MIRIKVTDEMVMELRTDPEDQGHACQCEKCTPGNLARVLAIIERELNGVVPATWRGMPVIDPAMLSEGTCIEVAP